MNLCWKQIIHQIRRDAAIKGNTFLYMEESSSSVNTSSFGIKAHSPHDIDMFSIIIHVEVIIVKFIIKCVKF